MKYFISGVFSVLLFFSASANANINPLAQLNTLYQTLLNEYGSQGEKNNKQANMIDYAAIRKDPRLNELVELLQNFPRKRLDSHEKIVAFYLNAYNILSIVKVAEHWPIKRLKSLGTFFKPVWVHPAGVVCGEQMTLRKLEHGILRELDEPRIHFALNCASMSCPDLRLEPYHAERLDQQLDDQAKIFLSQKGKGLLIKEQNTVKLSPIFDWFAEDFASLGGVANYVQQFLPKSDSPWEIVGYLKYDWDVTAHLTGSEKREIRRRMRFAKR